jgi:hypothetical protein
MLRSENRVVESLVARANPEAPTETVTQGQPAFTAASAVDRTLDLLARTVAPIHQPLRDERRQRLTIFSIAITLTPGEVTQSELAGLENVRLETQPIQIVEQCGLEVRPTPLTVVVLDAQQHPAAQRSRQAPHEDRTDDVSQV